MKIKDLYRINLDRMSITLIDGKVYSREEIEAMAKYMNEDRNAVITEILYRPDSFLLSTIK